MQRSPALLNFVSSYCVDMRHGIELSVNSKRRIASGQLIWWKMRRTNMKYKSTRGIVWVCTVTELSNCLLICLVKLNQIFLFFTPRNFGQNSDKSLLTPLRHSKDTIICSKTSTNWETPHPHALQHILYWCFNVVVVERFKKTPSFIVWNTTAMT